MVDTASACKDPLTVGWLTVYIVDGCTVQVDVFERFVTGERRHLIDICFVEVNAFKMIEI